MVIAFSLTLFVALGYVGMAWLLVVSVDSQGRHEVWAKLAIALLLVSAGIATHGLALLHLVQNDPVTNEDLARPHHLVGMWLQAAGISILVGGLVILRARGFRIQTGLRHNSHAPVVEDQRESELGFYKAQVRLLENVNDSLTQTLRTERKLKHELGNTATKAILAMSTLHDLLVGQVDEQGEPLLDLTLEESVERVKQLPTLSGTVRSSHEFDDG